MRRIFSTIFILAVSAQLSHASYVKSVENNILKKELKSLHSKVQKGPARGLARFESWGVDPLEKMSINITEARKKFQKKKNIVVAVVDTGVDPYHPFLKGNLHVLSGEASSLNYGIDFSKNPKKKTAPMDSHGHGTHIAGIIRSVFPEVKILTLKYFNPNVKNQDNLNSTIKALEYAVDKNVDIINYSSGGAGASYEELRILKKAEAKGILVVAAAGNESSNIDEKSNFYFPASYHLKNMITVINHDKKGMLNSTSNYGRNTADISAPGSRIRSSYPYSRAGYLTGTSQSTAFVTGVAALLMSQFDNLSIQEIKDVILKSAKKVKNFDKFCKSAGMLDASSAFDMARRSSLGKKNPLEKESNVRKLATK